MQRNIRTSKNDELFKKNQHHDVVRSIYCVHLLNVDTQTHTTCILFVVHDIVSEDLLRVSLVKLDVGSDVDQEVDQQRRSRSEDSRTRSTSLMILGRTRVVASVTGSTSWYLITCSTFYARFLSKCAAPVATTSMSGATSCLPPQLCINF